MQRLGVARPKGGICPQGQFFSKNEVRSTNFLLKKRKTKKRKQKSPLGFF